MIFNGGIFLKSFSYIGMMNEETKQKLIGYCSIIITFLIPLWSLKANADGLALGSFILFLFIILLEYFVKSE